MGAAAIPPAAELDLEPLEGPAGQYEAPCVTLLELVEAVSSESRNDREVIATVLHMLRRGSVVLRGSFRGLPAEQF
jgi:hypothetical protein